MIQDFSQYLQKRLPPSSHPQYEGFKKYVLGSMERGEEIIASLKPFVSLQGKKILDIGCADGGVAIAFAKAGCEVTALDADADNIEMAEWRARQQGVILKLVLQKAEAMHFSPNSFDGVILNDFLEYTQQAELIFEKLNCIIKPEGFCYIAVLNKLYHFDRTKRHTDHQRLYFYSELRRMLKRSGFEMKPLRTDFLKKLSRTENIGTLWRRRLVAVLKKMHLQNLILLWIHSPVAPWLEPYWKIIAIRR